MKINRNDIYVRIHKGLRKALFEFSEQTGKTNPGNQFEIKQLIDTGNKVFDFLEIHAEVEEKFQLPCLEKINPHFVIDDMAEHLQLEKIMDSLKTELSHLDKNANSEEALYEFYLHLNAFIGRYLAHMNHEEAVTAGHFIKHCDFTEMKRMVNSINAFTSPYQKQLALQYSVPAISFSERVDFLSEIKKENFQAYQSILELIKPMFSQQEWTKLTEELDHDEIEIVSLTSGTDFSKHS